MRKLLIALSFLLCVVLGRADDFPTDFPPTFKFHETYKDAVVADPDFPGDFLLSPRGDLFIQGVGSLSGYDLNQIDFFTGYGITVGDFEQEGFLTDDEDYDPTDPQHNRSFSTSLDGLDMNGDPITAGVMTILWSQARVTLTFTSHNATDQETVATADYYPDVDEPNIDRSDLIVGFYFGPFSLDLRSVYMIGSAAANPDPQGRVSDNLSDVTLDGAIDSIPPTLTTTTPVAGSTLTVNDSPNGFYNITGTVNDTRAVNGTTFAGTVNGVEVKLAANATDGTFVPAQLDGHGNWVLPNAQILTGKNFLTVRAFDDDGNTTTLPARQFKYSLQGAVTVTAAATGYSAGDNGKVAGTVSAGFFKVGSKKLTMLVGQTPPKDVTIQDAGDPLTVTAVPGINSVFNGWKGVINGNTVLDEVPEVLHFDARPDMTLTANFVPNPFTTTIVGKYQGLIAGTKAAERGSVKLTLTKTGGFTATIKLGAVVLPIKGKVLGSGIWRGTLVRGGKTYTINLNLNVAVAGEREITGTITSDGINSTLTADLNTWKSKTNEATAYMGNYTVLLPASLNNNDPGFPFGVGFGRVMISKLGVVKFVGKLGDGSPVAGASTLVKLTTGAVSFPLYLPLDKGQGSVSGVVAYDNTQASSDLTATLDWTEPVTTGVEPQAFEGQISLNGSLYTKPTSGLVILGDVGGAGNFVLAALPFSKPTTKPSPTSIGPTTIPVTLNATNAFGPVDQLDVKAAKLKINPATGLVTGSYFDSTFKKTIPIFGAVSRKANQAGGVFVRGNRGGLITLKP